jgi:hypothetical protein
MRGARPLTDRGGNFLPPRWLRTERLFYNCSSRRKEALIRAETTQNLSLLTSAATINMNFQTRSEDSLRFLAWDFALCGTVNPLPHDRQLRA